MFAFTEPNLSETFLKTFTTNSPANWSVVVVDLLKTVRSSNKEINTELANPTRKVPRLHFSQGGYTQHPGVCKSQDKIGNFP